MVIEPARESDTGRIHELVCELMGERLDSEAFARILAVQLAAPAGATSGLVSYVALVAREAPGAPALGFAGVRVEAQLHHAAAVATLTELVVDPATRGQGVGAALFSAVVAAAREAGCVQLELETHHRRHGAHRFYEREGMLCDHHYYTMALA